MKIVLTEKRVKELGTTELSKSKNMNMHNFFKHCHTLIFIIIFDLVLYNQKYLKTKPQPICITKSKSHQKKMKISDMFGWRDLV